jgi:hypothetical protein
MGEGRKGGEGDVRVVERRWSRWRRSWAQGLGSVARRRKASSDWIAVSFYSLSSCFPQLNGIPWLICAYVGCLSVCDVVRWFVCVLLWWRGRKNQCVCCQAGDVKVKWGRKNFGLVSSWVTLSWAELIAAGRWGGHRFSACTTLICFLCMHNYAQLCEWVELANWMVGKRLVTSPRSMDWKWGKPRCMEWLIVGSSFSIRFAYSRQKQVSRESKYPVGEIPEHQKRA